jgi:hypothetical protein
MVRVLKEHCEIKGEEGTTGVKRLKVRGFPSVRFCAILKAMGVNLMRATAVRKARGAGSQSAGAGRLLLDPVFSVVKERVISVWGPARPVLSLFASPSEVTQAHFPS